MRPNRLGVERQGLPLITASASSPFPSSIPLDTHIWGQGNGVVLCLNPSHISATSIEQTRASRSQSAPAAQKPIKRSPSDRRSGGWGSPAVPMAHHMTPPIHRVQVKRMSIRPCRAAAVNCQDMRLTPLHHFQVMRSKKCSIIVATPIVAVVAGVCFLYLTPKPRISMGVLEYVGESNRWFPAAIIGLTNVGAATIRYDHVDLTGAAVLWQETQSGWVSENFYIGGVSFSGMLLNPGSHIEFLVPLSDEARRWQFMYQIRNASIQGRIGTAFPNEWGDSLYRLSGTLGLTNEGPLQDNWSEVFKIPNRR